MSIATRSLSLTVNGKAVGPVEVPETIMMIDFLHEHLNLTGSRLGCGIGVCHACTVILDHPDGRSPGRAPKPACRRSDQLKARPLGPGRPADVPIGGFPRTALPNPACESSPHRALHMSRWARCGFPIPPSARAWGWPFPGIGTAWCVPRWG